MDHKMSRRDALALLGKLSLLGACGGTSSLNPTPTQVRAGQIAALGGFDQVGCKKWEDGPSLSASRREWKSGSLEIRVTG